METLVVAQHRNHHHQYYSRSRSQDSTKLGSFGSPPSGSFWGINCRTFQSGEGLLPNPLKAGSFTTTPVTKKVFAASFSPRTPSPSPNENQNSSKRITKSTSIPIPIKMKVEGEEFNFSERWAGPAYSNSPHPSSLPIPKFSVRPKRTVSLDLPTLASEVDLRTFSKSAPASPMRERSPSPSDLFDLADSATKTLRRILNLDITEE